MKKSQDNLIKVISEKELNLKIRPQDDFFEYACGGWIKSNTIPASESHWGSFDQLRAENDKRLRTLVEKVATKRGKSGSPIQLVRDFWLSGIDMKRRDSLGFKPLDFYIEKIQSIESSEELLKFISQAHRDGMGLSWSMGVGPDDHCADHNMLLIGQGGMSLPDRDYYIKKGTEYESVRTAYLEYIGKMLKLFGYTKEEAAKSAVIIMKFETRLARVSMTRTEMRDPHSQYNPHTALALKRLAPCIDWTTYFKLIGAKPKKVNVMQPKFFKEVNTMIDSVSLSAWRTYLLWHVINRNASRLSRRIGKTSFNFYGKTLQGSKRQRPLWRRVVASIDGNIGDALGQLYVAEYFPPRAKKSIDGLVKHVMVACEARIRKLDWMSVSTKRKALKKLKVITPKIGYPDKWIAYKGLKIIPNDYFGNAIRASQYEHKRDMAKIDKKVDPAEWQMTPSTVNAYFHPNHNEIVFPAGILQPPFFDVDAPDSYNYGAIGSVIGHEITHAFDDEGRKFDLKGNLKDWWTKEDTREFEKRTSVLKKQYDAFQVLPGFFVNGKLTLGENIADLGGLLIAYDAWQLSNTKSDAHNSSQSFTPEQLYFFGLVAIEKGSIRDAALKKRLVTDPHSPASCRVNGPFRNMDIFYEIFNITEKDGMYLPPNKRARIW